MDFYDIECEEVTPEEMIIRLNESACDYQGFVAWEKAIKIYAPYQTFYGVGIRNVPALHEKFIQEQDPNIRKIWQMFLNIACETNIPKYLFHAPEKLSPNLC
jgi:hypothetical protein